MLDVNSCLGLIMPLTWTRFLSVIIFSKSMVALRFAFSVYVTVLWICLLSKKSYLYCFVRSAISFSMPSLSLILLAASGTRSLGSALAEGIFGPLFF